MGKMMWKETRAKTGVNSIGIKVNADWGVDEVYKGLEKSTSHGRNKCQKLVTSQCKSG